MGQNNQELPEPATLVGYDLSKFYDIVHNEIGFAVNNSHFNADVSKILLALFDNWISQLHNAGQEIIAI